ncbi:MAG TPA: N-acetyltransferase [Edaphobacter sp.]|nr:N-acetyltransferase [Edaphobacter sp.]
MQVATQLEVLDIRHFSARQLRPLLESEADVWQQRLRWNYRGSTELLLQYLDSHILPGFVALDRGRICGFTFCVYEGSKAVVGDAYAVAGDREQALHITHILLDRLLDLLLHSPGINRIESQLLIYDVGSIDRIFRQAGFTLYPRLFMEYNLDPAASVKAGTRPELPEEIGISRWSGEYYQHAAELIHEAYTGHIDALINDQYCSLHGSLRFLHNIVRFPGCGIFDAPNSWVLREVGTDALAGLVLCSRVAEEVAHITQLCVAKGWRGHRLGRTLLEHCMSQLAQSGFKAITLTVTEANTRAVRLYEDLGFQTRHRFEAMVFNKP